MESDAAQVNSTAESSKVDWPLEKARNKEYGEWMTVSRKKKSNSVNSNKGQVAARKTQTAPGLGNPQVHKGNAAPPNPRVTVNDGI